MWKTVFHHFYTVLPDETPIQFPIWSSLVRTAKLSSPFELKTKIKIDEVDLANRLALFFMFDDAKM